MRRRITASTKGVSPCAALARLAPLALVALSLSACVGAGPGADGGTSVTQGGAAQVSRVILYPDTVTVEMRDRSLCTGPRTRPGPGWSGTLAGCRHLWPYQVSQPPQRNVRLPLQPGGAGAGQVVLTPPGGAPQIWSGPSPRQGS